MTIKSNCFLFVLFMLHVKDRYYEYNIVLNIINYFIYELISKSTKSHTIGESLIKSCMLKAGAELLGHEAQNKIREIPLSNDTVKSCFMEMSNDIEKQDTTKNVVILNYN